MSQPGSFTVTNGHAGLDQPAGEQRALAEASAGRSGSRTRPAPCDRSKAALAAGEVIEPIGLLERVWQLGAVAPASTATRLKRSSAARYSPAAVEPLAVDAGIEVEVADAEVGLGRVAADVERREGRRQVAVAADRWPPTPKSGTATCAGSVPARRHRGAATTAAESRVVQSRRRL